MASKDVKTSIEVTATTRQATDALEDVERAARDADEAVAELSDADVTVDTAPAVADLEQIDAAADGAETALRSIGDTPVTADTSKAESAIDELARNARELTREPFRVDIDVDREKVKGAAEDVRQIGVNAEGLQRGIGPLRGFTDELGDGAGKAGVFANAFIDAGEAVEIFGGQLGLSQQTLGRVSTGLGIAGLAIGAATAAWGLYTASQRRAKEAAEDLLEIQKQLREGNIADAATGIQEQFGGLITNLGSYGVSVQEAVGFITGELDKLNIETPPGWSPYYGENLKRQAEDARAAFIASGDAAKYNNDQYNAIVSTMGGVVTTTLGVGKAFGSAQTDATKFGIEAESQFKDVNQAARDLLDSVQTLDEQIAAGASLENKYLALKGTFEDVRAAGKEAWEAVRTGADDAETKLDDYIVKQNNATIDTLEFIDALGNVPAEVKARIAVLMEKGDLDAAWLLATQYFNANPVYVTPVIRPPNIPAEDWNMPAPPASQPRPGGGGSGTTIQSITVNMPRTADGQDVVAALEDWTRLDGVPI